MGKWAMQRTMLAQIGSREDSAEVRRFVPTKFGDHFFERREPLRVDEFQHAELEMQPRIGLATQIVIRGQQNIEKACEVFFAELSGVFRQSRALIGGRRDKFGIRTSYARQQQVAEVADGLAAEMLQVLSLGDEAMHEVQARSADCAAIAATRSSSTLSATTPRSSRTCASVIASPA